MILMWFVAGGCSEGVNATVRDLWLHHEMGAYVGSVIVVVASHDSAALTVKT